MESWIIITIVVVLLLLSLIIGLILFFVMRDPTETNQIRVIAPGKGNINNVPIMKPPTKNWSVFVDNNEEVSVTTPNIHFTDGFCTAHKSLDGRRWILFLSEADSFRQEASSPLFHLTSSWKKIMGSSPCTNLGKWPQLENNSPYSAGAWLMTSIRCPTNPNVLIGLLHQESRSCNTAVGQGGLPTVKSIGYTTSNDDGLTWTRPEQCLWVHNDTQGDGKFKGVGDFCCLFDHLKNEYKMFFHSNNKIGLATSKDPMAAPGTWKLWTRNGFIEPKNGSGSDLGHETLPGMPIGGNPSCYFCNELGLFLCIVCTWQNKLMISSSEDGITWTSKPFPLTPHPRASGGPWPYPIFCDEAGGSTYLTDKFWVYYSKTISGRRGMFGKRVTVKREN
jgi:hypothetical protein